MYISLYRRYRPQRFADVVGQKAAIGVISRAIESGAIGHAYLFSGPRGCGKTTVARLFAKAVNCPHRDGAEPCNTCETCRAIVEGNCLDVIEIDGASNNSVDEIRDLKEHVALASFTCPFKIYIIDEVHMLSISAFNALLKTLEEPPERVIFILATTAPHKVPVTIRSRCQHIPFHGMTSEQIVERLQYVAKNESITADDEALWEIARNSDGGMRDALSLMEQAIAFGGDAVTGDTIERLLGGGSSSAIRRWLSECHSKPENALPMLEELFRSGAVPERFISLVFSCVRNLWLQARWGEKSLQSLMLSAEERKWLSEEKNFLPQEHLERLMAQLASLIPQVRRGLSNDVLCGLLVSWIYQTSAAQTVTAQGQNFIAQKNPSLSLRPSIATPISAKSSMAPTPAPRAAERENSYNSYNEETVIPQSQESPSKTVDSEAIQQTLISADRPVGTVAAPNTDGLSPINDELAKLLAQGMADQPQIRVALNLADILWDDENKTASVVISDEENLAFEPLNCQQAAEAVRDLLSRLGRNACTVDFYSSRCRARFENLDKPKQQVPTPDAAENVSQTAPKFEPPAHQNNASAAQKQDEPGASRANNQAQKPQRKSGSLIDLLDNMLDAELLYCRPHEKSEEYEDEEDN